MNAAVSHALPAFPEGYTLDTERLVLRPPAAADIDAVWPHVSDERITRFLAWAPHTSREMTAGMVHALNEAQRAGTGFHWLVLAEGRVAGLVSLIDVRRTHRTWTIQRAELAYWLGVEHQGRGYATEACREVLRFAFGPLALHKIIVYHASGNPPSGAVVQRLGFRYVGEAHDAFMKDGQWHHLRQYEMLAREFNH